MMQNKLYLLLAILFVFVICSVSTDQKPRKESSALNDQKSRKDSTALDAKKKVVVQDKDEDEDDTIDDHYIPRGSYAHNRYTGFNPAEGNYRTRSRWSGSSPSALPAPVVALPSSYEEFMDENDWSPFGYGNSFSAPSPSAAYDSNPMSSNGPTCHSLIDPQYPVFSDTCGAVPQARYSLPNALGHRDRWQIAQILTSLMGSSTDLTCTRSLRLLLCPVLFPPCPTRREPSPVLPCQSYCRAVKARCAMPLLDLLPCEVLPYSSDICPTNQPYGSFMPQGPSPSQALSMTGGFPTSRSFPSLQSLLSSQGLQAAFSPQGFQSPSPMQELQAALSAQGFQSPASMQGFQSPASMQGFQSPASMQGFQSPASMQGFQSPASMQGFQSPASMQGFQSPVSFQDFQAASSPSAFTSGPTASPFNPYSGGSFSTDSFTPMFADFPSRSYANDYRQSSRYAPLTRSSSETRPSTEARVPTAARSSVVKA